MTIPSPFAEQVLGTATLADIEAMRLLLEGQSVIDWHRLSLTEDAQIDRFMRISGFDPDSVDDLNRLEDLRADAVEYCQRHLGYRIPASVAEELPVHELVRLASSRGRGQAYACVVLKVMHVMHHLAGRELSSKLPVSTDQIFRLVERKVVDVIDALRGAGAPIVEFSWSRKEHDSVVTKLLAKRDTIAADIYDKIRFRLVTKSRADIAAVMVELSRRLLPFNYVIPGESHNSLLALDDLLSSVPSLARLKERLAGARHSEAGQNEFSGKGYRAVNFVADLPIRMDAATLSLAPTDDGRDLGDIIFVLTEFQIVDAETARTNELGDSSHVEYKARQHERVKQRLSSGRALDEDTE